MKKLPITVILLTLNEDKNLEGALDNILAWAEDIFIVDSLSTDKTIDIALKKHVKIIQRPFTNFGDLWNWALNNLPITTPWTMKMDPDERLSNALLKELWKIFINDVPYDAFSFNRRLWLMGKPLHVVSPVLRLWRTGKCSFTNVIVNEYPEVKGRIKHINKNIEHIDSPNLTDWYEKQNYYTTMEAIARVKKMSMAANPRFFGSSLERRMFFKKLFYRIPLRYIIQWFFEAFCRGAILDGPIGLAWVRMRIHVQQMIELKMLSMHKTGVIMEMPVMPRGEYDPRILKTDLQKKFMSTGIANELVSINKNKQNN